MTVVVRSLASGSSGNALIVETREASLLIDCGITFRAIERGAAHGRRAIDAFAAVLVSHEHRDHVVAIDRLAQRGIAVVASEPTVRALELPGASVEPVAVEQEFTIGGMRVTALPLSHDAALPCGFSIAADGVRATVLTDFGRIDDRHLPYLAASDLLVVEANHDEAMLRRGPYPEHLKRRVLSSVGHLSNADCGTLLRTALGEATRPRTIWLAHLSATNNTPELAERTVLAALRELARHDVRALPRRGPSVAWRSDDVVGDSRAHRQLSLL